MAVGIMTLSAAFIKLAAEHSATTCCIGVRPIYPIKADMVLQYSTPEHLIQWGSEGLVLRIDGDDSFHIVGE